MILTVLALGGTLLGATTVAGLLTLYQIRNSTDLANSARAIFAADAGIEWALYNYFCSDAATSTCATAPPLGEFSNGAKVRVVCLDAAGVEPIGGCADPDVVSFRSIGTAGGSTRAFEASF